MSEGLGNSDVRDGLSPFDSRALTDATRGERELGAQLLIL